MQFLSTGDGDFYGRAGVHLCQQGTERPLKMLREGYELDSFGGMVGNVSGKVLHVVMKASCCYESPSFSKGLGLAGISNRMKLPS